MGKMNRRSLHIEERWHSRGGAIVELRQDGSVWFYDAGAWTHLGEALVEGTVEGWVVDENAARLIGVSLDAKGIIGVEVYASEAVAVLDKELRLQGDFV